MSYFNDCDHILPQTKADKSGRKIIFICPADDSGPNILHATGVENIQRAMSHGVYSSYVGLLSEFVERSGRLKRNKCFLPRTKAITSTTASSSSI